MPFDVAMTRLIGYHGRFYKKITASGLAFLLLVAGLPPTTAAAESCKDWNKKKFFKSATVEEVRACLSDGEDPNEQDTKGLTALHRAARETSDPTVIEALLDAGANPRASSIAGRLPWDFARRNDEIKGSAAYQRLRMAITYEARMADWTRLQALQPGEKIVVQAFNGMGLKVKGTYVSSDAGQLVVRRQSGQAVSIRKDHIRQVVLKRRIRHAVKIGAAAGFAVMASLTLTDKDLLSLLPHCISGGPAPDSVLWLALQSELRGKIILSIKPRTRTVEHPELRNSESRFRDWSELRESPWGVSLCEWRLPECCCGLPLGRVQEEVSACDSGS